MEKKSADQIESARLLLQSEMSRAVAKFRMETGFIPIGIEYTVIDASDRHGHNSMDSLRVSAGIVRSK